MRSNFGIDKIPDPLKRSKEGDILISNISYILWIGNPSHVPVIKSFTLTLRSTLPQNVDLFIRETHSSFYFTDEQGGNKSKYRYITLEPKRDEKFYVCFHPINSNYHFERIFIYVDKEELKIDLFGYAEPAIVDLKEFIEINDPNDMNKKALMKSFVKSRGRKKCTLSLINSGARTACVCFKSVHRNVTFQPRMLLLIPKTKMEFDVTINMTGNETSIQFFMFSVDEELRRAGRISVREFPSDDIYELFNDLQIFTNLPDEKKIQQDDLPKYDWAPYLYRQLMNSKKICYFKFGKGDTMSPGSESVEWSTAANEYFESLSINSFDGDDYGLHQTLSNVVILKDNNSFTPTYVKTSNYLGILIQNNNQFAVNWLISDMDDQSKCMSVTNKNGCLQPNKTTVVPVKFTPENTGMTCCRCIVKVSAETDVDVKMEKELSFSAESVRNEHTKHPEIPNLEMDKTIEVSYRLLEKNEKFELKILVNNKSNRNLQIYARPLTAPFNLSFCLPKGKSTLSVLIRLSRKGDFRDVAVLSDEAGNSTFTTLIVHVE